VSTLQKTISRRLIPGQAGSPGIPGQPFVPARTVYETRRVCGWYPFNPFQPGLPAPGSSLNGPSNAYPAYTYVCRDTMVRVDYPAESYIAPSPAVPGTPAQFMANFNLGWTGRGTSVQALPHDGYYSFKAKRDNIGAVVGLAERPADTGYSDIRFGFYLANGIARIFENGAEVHYHGQFSNSTTFTVRRSHGSVEYQIDDDVVYESDAPVGPLLLTAALYSGGDAIVDAEYQPLSSFVGVMAPMQGLAGDASYTGMIATGAFAPMIGGWGVAARFGGSVAPMAGAWSDRPYFGIRGVMAPMNGYAEGYADAPAYAIFSGTMAYPEGSANIVSGQSLSVAGEMSPMSGLAYDRPYGDFRGSMLPMVGYAEDLTPPGEATVFSGSRAGSEFTPTVDIFVVMNSSATAFGLLAAQVSSSADLFSTATASDSFTLQQVIEAFLMSTARVSSLQFDDPGKLEIWAMNTQTAGTTRYENFGFNSFAKIGGKYFGAKPDGIYELSGPDDAGVPVPARINLGNKNFGTALLKGLTELYVGVASNSKMVLKVVAKGETYYYTARSSSEELATHRVDLGRGFNATYFELELQNSRGSAFELASVEFTPVPLSRRI
jgi:hypothetical protein